VFYSAAENTMLGMAERWIYEAFDERFMPFFCNQSLKQNLFNKSSKKYGDQQIIALIVIMMEIYLSILSAVSTTVAPVMSCFAVVYSLVSLYSYLGLPSNKPLDIMKSYFASFKVSAFLLGYHFDACLSRTA